MTCREMKYNLPDFIAGEIGDREKASIEDHLASCADCRGEADTLRTLFSELEQVKFPKPSPMYWSSILPHVHEKLEQKAQQEFPAWITRLALPLSAAVVLVFFIVRVLPTDFESQSINTILSELKPDEIQQLADEESVVGSVIQSPETETGLLLVNDKGVLKEIVNEHAFDIASAELDPQSSLEELSDQYLDEVVSIMEHKSMNN